jgi:chromosome partitioning protein
MRTIAIVNQKGGCGKTTTSINLSAFLALHKRVLLVDLDPQGHATLGLSPNFVSRSKTISDLFLQKADGQHLRLSDIAYKVSENLDLAPADILLSGAPERLAGMIGRENVLSEALAEVGDRYDYILVDCPPGIGLLSFNALKACSEAIVPMDPSFFSLHGIGKVLETFDLLERETGHHVDARVLVTLYPGRSPYVKAVLEDVHTHLSGRCYQTFIRYSVKLAEAASHGLPITQYCTHCVGFDDYRSLAAEVLQQVEISESDIKHAIVQEGEPDPKGIAANGHLAWIDSPGVTVVPEGVVFTVDALAAQRVQLVGDFNGWSVEGSEMQRDGRFWRKMLRRLEPGRYSYRFIVDGNWQSDPLNTVVEPCPGGYNSVLVVSDKPTEAPLN